MVRCSRLVFPKNDSDLYLEGKKFGRLLIIRQGFSKIRTDRYGPFKTLTWACLCDCGNFVTICHYKLKSGHTKSCGCLQVDNCRDLFRTHGLSKSKEYQSWLGMRDRCYNIKHKRYMDWGGRGIKVCKRWKNSFENFFKDMGKCPAGKKSLDRINNDGDYKPSNCRWATIKEQNQNKRKRKTIKETK